MNVIDLIRRHGIEPRKASNTKGGEYHSPCPGCGGDDRFHVWPESRDGSGSYWCRQCGKSGDNIQFLRDFDGLNFHEACDRLGRKVPDSRNLITPKTPKKTKWEPRMVDEPTAQWREKALKFVTWSFEEMFKNNQAMEFLAMRGLTTDTAARFGLGWNSGKGGKDLYRSRESWGLLSEKNKKKEARRLWLPVGVIIPYFFDGQIQRIRIRRPDPIQFGPRYYVVPGSSMATMILNPESKVFVIVESELDAFLIVQAAGDLTGAMALGSVSGHPDQTAAKILKGALHIMNALDFDKAGAGQRAWWEDNFPDSERWPVQKGKDPGEAYQAGVDIRAWVIAGLPVGLRC